MASAAVVDGSWRRLSVLCCRDGGSGAEEWSSGRSDRSRWPVGAPPGRRRRREPSARPSGAAPRDGRHYAPAMTAPEIRTERIDVEGVGLQVTVAGDDDAPAGGPRPRIPRARLFVAPSAHGSRCRRLPGRRAGHARLRRQRPSRRHRGLRHLPSRRRRRRADPSLRRPGDRRRSRLGRHGGLGDRAVPARPASRCGRRLRALCAEPRGQPARADPHVGRARRLPLHRVLPGARRRRGRARRRSHRNHASGAVDGVGRGHGEDRGRPVGGSDSSFLGEQSCPGGAAELAERRRLRGLRSGVHRDRVSPAGSTGTATSQRNWELSTPWRHAPITVPGGVHRRPPGSRPQPHRRSRRHPSRCSSCRRSTART